MASHERNPDVNTPKHHFTTRNTTKANFRKAEHTWTIENFQKLMKMKVAGLRSPVFTVPVDEESGRKRDMKFYLWMGFNIGKTKAEVRLREYVALGLYYKSSGESDRATVKFRLFIRRRNGASWNVRSDPPVTMNSYGWVFHDFARKDALSSQRASLTPEGSLTVVCQMELFCPHPQLTRAARQPPGAPNLGELVRDTGDDFVDVVLLCGSRCFRCHRVVLGSQSEVLAAEIAARCSDDPRDQAPVVPVEGVDPWVLEDVLSFMYTGECHSLTFGGVGEAEAVLGVADKYEMRALKHRCEQYLSGLVDPDSVVRIALMADKYGARLLERHVAQHVAQNLGTLLSNGAWIEVSKNIVDKAFRALKPSTTKQDCRALLDKATPEKNIPCD